MTKKCLLFFWVVLWSFSTRVAADDCSRLEQKTDAVLETYINFLDRSLPEWKTDLAHLEKLIEVLEQINDAILERGTQDLTDVIIIKDNLDTIEDAKKTIIALRRRIASQTANRALFAGCLQQRERERERELEGDGGSDAGTELDLRMDEDLNDDPRWWAESDLRGGSRDPEEEVTVDPSDCQGPPEVCGYGDGDDGDGNDGDGGDPVGGG